VYRKSTWNSPFEFGDSKYTKQIVFPPTLVTRKGWVDNQCKYRIDATGKAVPV
jgi:hypothetical protein